MRNIALYSVFTYNTIKEKKDKLWNKDHLIYVEQIFPQVQLRWDTFCHPYM